MKGMWLAKVNHRWDIWIDDVTHIYCPLTKFTIPTGLTMTHRTFRSLTTRSTILTTTSSTTGSLLRTKRAVVIFWTNARKSIDLKIATSERKYYTNYQRFNVYKEYGKSVQLETVSCKAKHAWFFFTKFHIVQRSKTDEYD